MFRFAYRYARYQLLCAWTTDHARREAAAGWLNEVLFPLTMSGFFMLKTVRHRVLFWLFHKLTWAFHYCLVPLRWVRGTR